MRLLAVILMGALSSTSVWAQGHLRPDESPFHSSLPEYYSAVGKVLLADVPLDAPTVVSLPSLEVEWSAWVLKGPEPKACSRVASAPIWNGDKPSEPHRPRRPPSIKCVPLSRSIADDVEEVWGVMLRDVRNPPPSNVITLDGVSYHFAGFDNHEHLAGQVDNPEPDTTTGRLVAAAIALRAYSTNPSPEGEKTLCRLVAAIRPESRRVGTRCMP